MRESHRAGGGRWSSPRAALLQPRRKPQRLPRRLQLLLRRHLLLNGLDDIGQTLQHAPAIDSFESKQKAAQPWLYA